MNGSVKRALNNISNIQKQFQYTQYSKILQHPELSLTSLSPECNFNQFGNSIIVTNDPEKNVNTMSEFVDYGNGNLLEHQKNDNLIIDILPNETQNKIPTSILFTDSMMNLTQKLYQYANELNYFQKDHYKTMIIDYFITHYHYYSHLCPYIHHYDEEPNKNLYTTFGIPCIPLSFHNIEIPSWNIYSNNELAYYYSSKELEKEEGVIHDYQYLKSILEPVRLIDEKQTADFIFLSANARIVKYI